MSKNRGKSKLSKNVLFNANKHVFHCEKSLGTFFYGQPSYNKRDIYQMKCKGCQQRYIGQASRNFEIRYKEYMLYDQTNQTQNIHNTHMAP
jgi:hypothetical protein